MHSSTSTSVNLNFITNNIQSVAKDGNASLGSRATAAKDAVGDKMDQTSHNTKADVHKEVCDINYSNNTPDND